MKEFRIKTTNLLKLVKASGVEAKSNVSKQESENKIISTFLNWYRHSDTGIGYSNAEILKHYQDEKDIF